MHEISLVQSLLCMAEEEIFRRNCARLLMARVEYGALSGVVPKALQFCFDAMIQGTQHEGARLELACLPLRLRCPFCGRVFGGQDQDALHLPCPGCGELFGHIVEQGKELILSRLEIL
ncbi:putative hydrogenase nickel incorporation protein HypA 1 [Deltaproteobacteria bacterium]|nr:putative hydrogenase nickel incorporation protein HypA 1 [Deltaproteobacteria bacterium]